VTPAAPKPGNYLVWSIVSALLCCLPLGAVGIYFAIQVDKRYMAGDLAGAQAASRQARTWTIVTVSVGLLGLLFFLILGALQNS
jgi:interferon-induced transmembrane protein